MQTYRSPFGLEPSEKADDEVATGSLFVFFLGVCTLAGILAAIYFR